MVYTNSVSANDWISGFTDNDGVGKIVGWQTDLQSKIGQYTVTVEAWNTCVTGTASYVLEVITVCNKMLLQIDTANLIFTSPALVQDVWADASDLFWDVDAVTQQYPLENCGPIEWELVDQLD